MANLVKRAFFSLIGMVVVLAYWSITGDGSRESGQGIPASVWDGHASTVEVEVDSSCPARLSMSFNEEREDGRSLETWAKMPKGSKSWKVQVPLHVSGYVDLVAEDPKPGDRLAWTIRVDDRVVDEQAQTLEEPLEAGYAFGLQSYFDDYATGELGDG